MATSRSHAVVSEQESQQGEEAATMLRKRVDSERTLVVGVDVASEQHVGFIRGPTDLEVGPFAFRNDRSGFQLLASKVAAAQGARGQPAVVFALEPTGP